MKSPTHINPFAPKLPPLPPKPPTLPLKLAATAQTAPAAPAKPRPLPPVGAKPIDGKACTKCGSTIIAKPVPNLAVCSQCGHHMPIGRRLSQRPVTRADLMGTAKGSPFRY